MVGGGGGGDMQRQCADTPEGEPRLLGPGGRGRGSAGDPEVQVRAAGGHRDVEVVVVLVGVWCGGRCCAVSPA